MEQDEPLPLCTIAWIGYRTREFEGDQPLARRVRKLLRNIMCRSHDILVEGEQESFELDCVTDYSGQRVGFGVIIGTHITTVNISDPPDTIEEWLDELGEPLEKLFDKTYEPSFYITIGRTAS